MLEVGPGDVFCKLPHDTSGRCLLVELRPGGELLEWDARDPRSAWSGTWELREGQLAIDIGAYSLLSTFLRSSPVIDATERGPHGSTQFLLARVLPHRPSEFHPGATLLVARPGRLPVACHLGRFGRARVASPAGRIPDEKVRWDSDEALTLTMDGVRSPLSTFVSREIHVFAPPSMTGGVEDPRLIAVVAAPETSSRPRGPSSGVARESPAPTTSAPSSPAPAPAPPPPPGRGSPPTEPRSGRAAELLARCSTPETLAAELVRIRFQSAAISSRARDAYNDPALRAQLVADMQNRIENVVNHAVIQVLSTDEAKKLEQLLDRGASGSEVQEFIARAVPNAAEVSAAALEHFLERELPAGY